MRRTSNHLAAEQSFARDKNSYPKGAITIASQDGDEPVLLPGSDAVHLWAHKTGELRPVTVRWSP